MSGTAAAAVALTVNGCSVTGAADARDDSDDVALVEAALDEELAFGAFCDRLGDSHRAFAVRLAAVSATQAAHADALSATLDDPPASTTEPEPSNSSIRSVSRQAARLHDRRMADCRAAEAGALAQLLGSIAASHAVTARYWRTQ